MHDHILRVLNESKKTDRKATLESAVKLLKEAAQDLEPQERTDLTSAILDIEDISSRISPA